MVKKKQSEPQDERALKADVASFAANIGLAASQDGFNDVDFRKKGPLNKPKAKPADKVRADGKNPRNAEKNAKRPKENRKRKDAGARLEDVQTDVAQNQKFSTEKAGRFGRDVCRVFSRWGETGEKWYDTAAEAASKLDFAEVDVELSGDAVRGKREQSENLLKMVAADFERFRTGNSDMRMVLSARRSGTSADKVAAMTVLIQENPVANLHTLDSLLAMVSSKGGKRHALSAIEVLMELFIKSLLPDRKLKPFASQPLSKLPDSKEGASLLLWWFWEDCIKERYEKFVNAVIEGSKDSLTHLKLKSIKTLYELLKAKPEHEKKLLTALVNKLGDPERKPASNASYLLWCLLVEHPNMKQIVLREVDRFVFRPNLGLRAVYYACIFMNRIHLSHKGAGPVVAKQLVDIYFGLFKSVIKVKPQSATTEQTEKSDDPKKPSVVEADSRLLSSLLTGINRAFGFVAEDSVDAIVEEHTPTLFRLVHSSNFNVGVQALLLLYQILHKHQAVSERFYRTLYSVIVSPALAKSSKIEMFLTLVLKVLKSDVSSNRTCAFMKRLMQTAMHQSPELSCAFLVIISEVLKVRPLLWTYILEPPSEYNDIEAFKDVDGVETEEQPQQRETALSDSESDIEVNDNMVKDLGDDVSNSEDDLYEKNERQKTIREPRTLPSVELWQQASVEAQNTETTYNPRHRDPLYCKAEFSCWWELTVLASHIHPSVSAMTKSLISGVNIVYSGDPLHDLAFSAFLDRFAEKKRRAPKIPIESEFNPDKSNMLVGMELACLAEENVAPADLIFHKFYSAKAAAGKRKKSKKKSDVMDEDLVGSGEDDDDEADFGEEDVEEAYIPDEEGSMSDELDDEEDEEEGIDHDDENDEDVKGDASEDAEDDDDTDNEEIDKLIDEDMEDDDTDNEEIDKLVDAGLEFSDDDDEDEHEVSDDDDEEFVMIDNGKLGKTGGADRSRKKAKKPSADKRPSSSKKRKANDVEEKAKVSGHSHHGSSKKRKTKSVEKDDASPWKRGKKKVKSSDKVGGSSSFASAEEYAHLFGE